MSRGQALGDCAEPLVQRYDAALLDLDGVLHLGDDPVPHAAASLERARAAGVRLAFVTNNASRAPELVAQRLTGLGIPAEPADVVTSAQAAARVLAEHLPAGATVLVVGTDALADEVRAVGLRPVRTVEQAGEGGPAAVAQGLSQETGWADLAEAAVALHRGALWVAGNLDATLPTGRGPLPGNGAMVAALRLVTGREPLVAGKPEPALHRESVERVGSAAPLVVGDRLDTDVLGAVRGGSDSLLVLTGVVDLPALLAAPAGSRPTYVAADLRGLLQPQPPVRLEQDAAVCGTGRAVRDGDAVRLDGVQGEGGPSGEPDVEQLRALCALAWALADGAQAS